MKLVLITGNENKLKEIKNIIGTNIDIINIKIDLPEVQSIDVKEVIENKIDKAYEEAVKILGNNIAVICEDTGLHIDNMYEFPGALIKYYYESVGNQGIVHFNGGSSAKIRTIVGLKNKMGKYFFEGTADGSILNDSSKIIDGFGWDPIFIPYYTKEYKQYFYKSYSEIPIDIKNKISARYNAFIKLKEFISKKNKVNNNKTINNKTTNNRTNNNRTTNNRTTNNKTINNRTTNNRTNNNRTNNNRNNYNELEVY